MSEPRVIAAPATTNLLSRHAKRDDERASRRERCTCDPYSKNVFASPPLPTGASASPLVARASSPRPRARSPAAPRAAPRIFDTPRPSRSSTSGFRGAARRSERARPRSAETRGRRDRGRARGGRHSIQPRRRRRGRGVRGVKPSACVRRIRVRAPPRADVPPGLLLPPCLFSTRYEQTRFRFVDATSSSGCADTRAAAAFRSERTSSFDAPSVFGVVARRHPRTAYYGNRGRRRGRAGGSRVERVSSAFLRMRRLLHERARPTRFFFFAGPSPAPRVLARALQAPPRRRSSEPSWCSRVGRKSGEEETSNRESRSRNHRESSRAGFDGAKETALGAPPRRGWARRRRAETRASP